MRGKVWIGSMVVGIILVICPACAGLMNVNGFTEIINYRPNEGITFRAWMINNADTAINVSGQVGIPWGSEPLLCNFPIYGVYFPNANKAHEYEHGYYRGAYAGIVFQKFKLEPREEKEIIYILKINDWIGQCPTGRSLYQPFYQSYVTDPDDVIMEAPIIISEDVPGEGTGLWPREGTLGIVFGGPPLFKLNDSIFPNRYGAFPSREVIYVNETSIVSVKVFNGSGIVRNATVHLKGCGVNVSSSSYPYEFEITPIVYGKIRIIANWMENNISMRGEGFISVTKPGGLIDWDNVKIKEERMPDNSYNISVNVSEVRGKEYIDQLILKYSPADRPWAKQKTMEKHGDKYAAKIEPFPVGTVVNYTINGFDVAGICEEIANKSFIITPPSPYNVRVWAEPAIATPGNISIVFAEVTENKTPVQNISVTFTTDFGMFKDGDTYTNITTNITNESGVATAYFLSFEEGTAHITATVDGVSDGTIIEVLAPTFTFDTGEGGYPSIMGIFNGTITPFHDVIAEKLYVYPCEGTGGHAEYVRIWNESWSVNGTWEGYKGDWHNISFKEPVVLEAGKTYNITIRTGSYPQIHHVKSLKLRDGWINCTEFIDVNGKKYYDWIPAIKLLD